jgi:2-dehydropantoate 2-reductase
VQIGIVGAGGIGGFYAALLSRAGHTVRVLARGDHLAAINTRGLQLKTPTDSFVTHPEAFSDPARLIGCDHVIVSVKSYSLPEVGPALVAAAKSGSAIVPLLNGIDAAERLAKLGVPKESIIGGFVRASLERTAPGVVELKSAFDVIVLGELDCAHRERTTSLVAAISGAGATARESDNILYELWRKFAFIVPMGVGCGLARQPMGPVMATERGRDLIKGAVHEIVGVSQGVLSADDAPRTYGELAAIAPGIKPSFLLDLERGGPTELDLLAGTVSRLGKELGVPTPIHDVATAAFESATLSPS